MQSDNIHTKKWMILLEKSRKRKEDTRRRPPVAYDTTTTKDDTIYLLFYISLDDCEHQNEATRKVRISRATSSNQEDAKTIHRVEFSKKVTARRYDYVTSEMTEQPPTFGIIFSADQSIYISNFGGETEPELPRDKRPQVPPSQGWIRSNATA